MTINDSHNNNNNNNNNNKTFNNMQLIFNSLAELDTFLHKQSNIVYIIENVSNDTCIELVTYSLDKTLKHYNTLMSNRKSDSQFIIKTINTETQEQKVYTNTNIQDLFSINTLITNKSKINLEKTTKGWSTKDNIHYTFTTEKGHKYHFIWLGTYARTNGISPDTPKKKLLWATHNIDMTKEDKQTENTADYGSYFRWGYTMAVTADDSTDETAYTWESKEKNDAAYVNWGDFCRMPTADEFETLGWKNGVTYESDGVFVTPSISKSVTPIGLTVISSNGASVFFPFAGYCNACTFLPSNAGSNGNYWSSTENWGKSETISLFFNSDGRFFPFVSNYRCYGFAIRPVAEIEE